MIELSLSQLWQQQRKAVSLPNGAYDDLLKQLAVLTSRGGKRLRPLIFLAAYEWYGGGQKRAARQVALSLELLHAFLLIHDDIIDRDYDRWGGHNILGHYLAEYSGTMSAPEALHFAEAQALLAGNICMSLANRQLLASGFAPEVLLAAATILQDVIQQVVNGETTDLEYVKPPLLPNAQDILRMYQLKTASYSFGLPLRLAALLAGADDVEQAKLVAVADKVGVAYQLQDDLLGMFGTGQLIGKSTVSDLREGKRTVLVVQALAKAEPKGRQQLLSVLGNTEATPAAVQAAKSVLIDSGARRFVENLAANYLRQASEALAATTMQPGGKRLLTDMITAMQHRQN
jgi:geranylgeranyl diphosphate synthase type II